jgi:hypothetical protein
VKDFNIVNDVIQKADPPNIHAKTLLVYSTGAVSFVSLVFISLRLK